jgi:putative PIN family toxin of toxin-antitoxin system
MTKVVLDTNVVVSANLVDRGPSAAIFDLATRKKAVRMCVSPAILAEYERVLRRPRFKFSLEKIEGTLEVIRGASELVHPTRLLKISADDSDNRFYECAEAAKADYLITGNTGDFPKDHGPTKIIAPRAFLDVVVPQLGLE